MDVAFLADLPFVTAVIDAPDFVWAAIASALATLGLTSAFGPRRTAKPGRAPRPDASTSCDFLIHGGALRPLGEPARALAEGWGPGNGGLAGLRAYLATGGLDIDEDLERLVTSGATFRRHWQRTDGTAFTVEGEPRGAVAHLTIRPASPEARALHLAELNLKRAVEEARFLRFALDRAPILAWSASTDQQVVWANAGYRDRFAPAQGDLPDHRIPDAFRHVLDEVPLTSRSGDSRRRVALPGSQGGEAQWFEVSQSAGPAGETLSFALEADDLVVAEASLRRFIETLTETFAHLPIGLAVFDKNRRLGLFNPALTDLVKIDAVWLAGRPSLRDFLERLRETRQMPEQKDFAAWRRKLGELEEGARDGTYEENWVLPSGKVFHVTGRPHPQGALAFLFEDISTAVQLERKYRSELELSQATLDRMAEAVAVFDTTGMLVFVNAAFEAMWNLTPMDSLDSPDVGDLTRIWAQRCRPSPVWTRLREFVTGDKARSTTIDVIETRDGRVLQMLVAPLPDASALVVFRNLSEEALTGARLVLEARQTQREADDLIAELAQAQIEMPVEAAVSRIEAALPTAASSDTHRALSEATEGLRDGLAQSRALREIARAPLTGLSPAPGLGALLEARGLAFELIGDALIDSAGRRRAVWALALAAAEMATPGAVVRVVASREHDEAIVLTAGLAGPTEIDRVDGVSLALARWIVGNLGGVIDVATDPETGRTTLSAVLPTPRGNALRGPHPALSA